MAGEYSDASLNNRYRTTTCTLQPFGSVGDRQSYNILNRYLTILSATFPNEADLALSLNDDPFTPAFKSIQFDFRENPVEKVTILNTNAVANTVTMAFSSIPVIDNRSTVTGSVLITGGVAITAPTILDSLGDVAVTTGVATRVYTGTANTDEVWVQNPEALGGTTIRVGDSGVGAANGILLPPQGVYIANVGAVTTGDVWVFHSKGSTINIPVTAFSA
jgi:hypothetical protein